MGSWSLRATMTGTILRILFCLMMLERNQARGKRIVLDDTLVPEKAEFSQSRTSQYIENTMTAFERRGSGRKPVGNKTYVFGTDTKVFHGSDDKGFMSVVFEAYAKHLTLVTSPEDWWLTVVQRVAQAIDKNSGKETVRNHFVSHQDKKELFVDINDIYDIKESSFFSQISKMVEENIKDPGYVKNMQADFTTTTPLHGIVFNIATMSSLQQFFEFGGGIACGIPQLDMKGTVDDWRKLLSKLSELRNRLATITRDIGLPEQWWNQIIEKRRVNVVCGYETQWNGWFLKDFLGLDISKVDSSLVAVPLTIDDNGFKTQAALVAGIAGFKLGNNKTSIEAQHAWNFMLDPSSYLRKDLL